MPSGTGKPLRIGLAAGELSGDQLAAAVIRAIHEIRPEVEFEGVAGPAMRAAGCTVLARTEQLSVMGLVEVLGRLPVILGIRRRLRKWFLDHPPDVFLGIDAPDFNLSMERQFRAQGIPTVHLASPSVWAWRAHRVRKIRTGTDLMLTLFPFEKPFYEQEGVPVRYIGHPLADDIPEQPDRAEGRQQLDLDPADTVVALLPGSRGSEVRRLLPLFLRAAAICRQSLPSARFLLPVATPVLQPLCKSILKRKEFRELPVRVLCGRARVAMQAADAVLLASGTAALECMLMKRPMVVAYRMHPLSYPLVKKLLRVPWVSLPNHLLKRAQVPEYLQGQATPQALAEKVLELIRDPQAAAQQVAPFVGVHQSLRRGAARQAAREILASVNR
jgi:lipid-A-disaccharide synthase